MAADDFQLAARIKDAARRLGFDLVGIAPAGPSAYGEYLRQWLQSGQAGEMKWLHGRFEERTDPSVYLPGARSVVCVAMNYHTRLQEDSAGGKIARYALGDDYHEVIKSRLHRLADWMRTEHPEAETRAAVDTAPVMEKELAARAGVGWQGKHTCIINPQIGSWLLLGEVITTLELPADEPAIDRCGTCTRCIDACPTGAITAPYQLDARKCISYLTIEHRDEIAQEYHRPIGEWIFGCDICQEVCPWNGKAPLSLDLAVKPRFAGGRIEAEKVLEWGAEEYRTALKGSAMKRVKLPVLQRNARIVLENERR